MSTSQVQGCRGVDELRECGDRGTHGSPWRYDTYVRVIFAGAGLSAHTISRPITPYDIAPTLAAYLGVKPPSAAIANPLPEVRGD